MSVRALAFPLSSATRQSGFSLIEMTMALVLLGAMSLGVLQVQQFQQHVENGRQAGLRLAALRDGAEQYVRDHAQALLVAAQSTAGCAEVVLSRQHLASGPTPKACALEAKAGAAGQVPPKPLAVNALQPTFLELKALGYVALDERLPFPHGDTIVDGRTGRTAEPRWAVSVQCHGSCETGGSARTAILRVTLYNTQPFFAQGALPFGYGAQLKAALQALGPDAMVSLPGESAQHAAQLRGRGATPVTNPLRGEADGTGVPGVLASSRLVHLGGAAADPGIACRVPAGADAPDAGDADASGVTCRNGSAKPMARWDFNGQDLDNVGHLGVAGNATLAGTVTAGGVLRANGGLTVRHPTKGMHTRVRQDGSTVTEMHAVVDVDGHAIVRRKLVVGADVDGYTFDPNEKGGMLLMGRLSVPDGFVDLSGRSGLDTRQGGHRLPHRYPDQPCNDQEINTGTSGGNIALYRQANSPEVFVMACNGQGRWVKAKAG